MKIILGKLIPQILFVVAMVLFVVVAFLTVRGFSALTEALRWEKHTQQILLKLDEVLITTTNAESAARSFFIVPDENALKPYNEARQNIKGQISQLRELTKDNPSQTEKLAEFEKLTDERFSILKQFVEIRRVQDLEAITSQTSVVNRSKKLGEDIQLSINRMKADESNLYSERENTLNENLNYTRTVTYLAGLTGILFLGIAAFINFREGDKRIKAEEDLRVANKGLEKRVDERTHELKVKNDELEAQIRQREQSEQYHRIALESGNLGAWRFDRKNNRSEVDERGLSFFGFTAEDFDSSGMTIFSRIHAEDLPLIEKEFQDSLAEKRNFNVEFRVPTADGFFKWANCTGQPQLDENGEITYVIGNCRDITEGKESEIALRRSEKQVRNVIDNLFAFVGVLSPEGVLLEANKTALNSASLNAEDVIGKEFADTYWWSYSEEIQEQLRDSILKASAGESIRYDVTVRVGENQFIPIDFTIAPLYDEDGRITHLIPSGLDLTPRKKAEEKLEELFKLEKAARKDAEIANRMRDEFLATVSHELRAPLNSILGWGRLLQKGNLDEPTTEKAITTIVRNAESQNRLIEDLLDVSRIISGKLRLEVMTIKPINIVESALENVRPAAEAKGIILEIKQDAEISHISGDPNRLQQVIWNLLSNAIKFTPNDGRVTLEIERENDFVNLRVKDTGVGIKEEFLPHVFERFRQADASSIRKFGGLGLGLAIVRHITEMHGGTVHVDSKGEGKGSTFTVRLPLVISPEVTESQKSSGELHFKDKNPNMSLDGLLILVVDDEEDTRQLLVQALTFYGATVVSADSAEEALTEIQDKNPDIIVSDIGMPDEDGYTLIRKIRNLPDEQQRNTIAVALTAFTRAQDRMRALAAGFQNHVSKPVEPDELVTVIASLTGRLQIGDED